MGDRFKRGREYRELSPVEGRFIYRYKTVTDCFIPVPINIDPSFSISFFDLSGREWMWMNSSGVLVKRGYAWNGCSPKRWIPILGWVGTIDFKGSIMASMAHDSLCQFYSCGHFPLSKMAVDNIFYDLMIRGGMSRGMAGLYHEAVRRFGDYRKISNKDSYSELKIIGTT